MSASAILRFDTEWHPFDVVVSERVCESLRIALGPKPSAILSNLHQYIKSNELDGIYAAIYELFFTSKFTQMYDDLCAQTIEEQFGGKAAYQRIPTVRIQLPGQTTVNYHTDEWYGHGHNVQNFWLPLTTVAGTNSMFVIDEATSLNITQAIREKTIHCGDKSACW